VAVWGAVVDAGVRRRGRVCGELRMVRRMASQAKGITWARTTRTRRGRAWRLGKAGAHRDHLGVTDTSGPVSSSPARSGDARPLGWSLSQALSIMHSSGRLPLHIGTTLGGHEDEAPTAPHS